MATINGTVLADILIGTNSSDIITGLGGNDTLIGLGGNDTLDGGIGADVMVGGAGYDTYVVDNAGDRVVEGSDVGIDHVRSSITLNLGVTGMLDVEYLTLTGALALNGFGNAQHNLITGNANSNTLLGRGGNDALYGMGGNDLLYGETGNDLLFGGAGNDVLDGGLGADTMRGEAGNDRYFVDSTSDIVIEAAGGGNDIIHSSVTLTLSAAGRFDVEHLVLTGTSALDGSGNALGNGIFGTAARNVLSGFAGNDQLVGNGGNDHLDGGLGADMLWGGTGNDSFVVDNAGDIVRELASEGTDLVLSSIGLNMSTTFWAAIERLTLLETGGAISGIGNALDNLLTGNNANNLLNGLAGIDYIYGQGGNDILQGGAGNDFLNGGAGIDTMQGGAGNDTFVIDNAGDFVIEAAGGGTADRIQTYITATLSVNGRFDVENLELYEGAAINGTGNALNNSIAGNSSANALSGLAGNDVLHGQGGNDVLNGGTSNDLLRGGLGADTIIGGLGSDTFAFDTALGGGNIDAIVDFVPVNDTIQLENAVFAALPLTGPLAASAFRIGAGAADASDRIIYNAATGAVYYDADGIGGAAQIQFADLASNLAITNLDFVIV